MTSLVAFDGPIGQLDIILTYNQPHQIVKSLTLQTVSIQVVKRTLQVIILRIADFVFPGSALLLLRSQHRHPPLSDWIFFVILEAAFVVFSIFVHFRLEAVPPQVYYSCFISTTPPLSPGLRTVITSHPAFPVQRPATACFIRSRLSTFRQSYHRILLGSPSKPAPSSRNLAACNSMWISITTSFTHPRVRHINGHPPFDGCNV